MADELRFVHFSDPHIVGREVKLRDVDTCRTLERVVERVNALRPRPEFVLVGGDLASPDLRASSSLPPPAARAAARAPRHWSDKCLYVGYAPAITWSSHTDSSSCSARTRGAGVASRSSCTWGTGSSLGPPFRRESTSAGGRRGTVKGVPIA